MGILSGRCALVVGGAGGIGGGIAKAFLSEGASVVIADFDETITSQRATEIGSHGVSIDEQRMHRFASQSSRQLS